MNPTWPLNLAHGPIGRLQDNVFSIIIKTSSLINHCLQKWSVFCLLVSNDITFPVSRHKPAGLPNIHHWNYYGLPYSIYYHIHAIIGYCKSIKCLFADTNGHHDTTSVKWNKYFTNYKNILRQLQSAGTLKCQFSNGQYFTINYSDDGFLYWSIKSWEISSFSPHTRGNEFSWNQKIQIHGHEFWEPVVLKKNPKTNFLDYCQVDIDCDPWWP